MPQPGVHIEILHGRNPAHYSPAQIQYAAALAATLDRGRLLIVEPPALQPTDNDDPR